ncbi:MAG: glycoside hydrolase family 3 C-terminal domain-containing protein [Anaerolineae bacterium]|jgi:beta-glucosidase
MTNVKLTGPESIPAVVSAMTLEEKALFVAGAGAFQTNGIERLGIPRVIPLDGHNGMNMAQYLTIAADRANAAQGKPSGGLGTLFGLMIGLDLESLEDLPTKGLSEEALAAMEPEQRAFMQAVVDEFNAMLPEAGMPTCFPPGILMASTWDPELVGECATAVAREAKAFNVGMVLGPNLNIHRNPLCGRTFESYGEDPYLAGRIAVSYVKGMQEEGVAADVKHFAANNQETNRQRINEHIPERALREIYLPAFRAAIEEGDCWTVMSAYNKINGTDCAMNRWLLTDLLRGEWGFDGFVVADWGAAYDRVEALLAGNDLEMPGPQDPQVIIDSVREGRLPEEVLDERVANILGVWVKLWYVRGEERPPLDREFSVRMAREIAEQGSVLLKNENNALPLTGEGPIAVLGENALSPFTTGGGSAGVTSPYKVSLLQGLQARYGEAQVQHGTLIEGARAAIVAVGVNSSEGADRKSMDLPATDVALIRETAARCKELGIPCIVVLNVCGPVEMASWVDEVDAVLLIWLAGMELGHATAALLAGDQNPSGKLICTLPRRYQDVPSALNFPGEAGEVWYGEGIYVGYRYYDAADVKPLYAFGHGLSYTSFELSNLRLSAAEIDLDGDEPLTVSVDVRNTGDRRGAEVVQLYLADVASTLQVPPKELKGFRKVWLDPGETRTVELTLDRRALEHWDPTEQAWLAEPGEFRVLVGVAADDIRLEGTFNAVGTDPYAYGPRTTMGRIVGDPEAMNALVSTLIAELGNVPPELFLTALLAPLKELGTALEEIVTAMLPEAADPQREAVIERIYEALRSAGKD